MADVFLSYKSEDRRRLEVLVSALERDGVDVWWDARIGAGEAWREEIQTRLDAARCVIVAWSRRSTAPEGRFVRDEATRAQRRGVYLPVRLDDAEPPLGFGEVQAPSLDGWRGGREHPGYQALLAAVRALVDAEPLAPASAPPVRFSRRHAALAGVGGLALVVGGVAALRFGGQGSRRPGGAVRIAVLPFANLSGDPAQAYFSEGVSEELRSVLSRLPGVEIIGAVSSLAVREFTPVQVAQKLGATEVLTGSVRRAPSLIRVAAQLIEGRSGVQRWSDTYDRAPGDALALESGIAESVADALRLRLSGSNIAALELGGTRNVGAHELYLRAQALWRNGDDESATRAVLALSQAALQLDPGYADALVLQARTLSYLAGMLAVSADAARSGLVEAEAVARRAIAVAPGLASTHIALGSALELQLDFKGALESYRRGLALNPSGSSLSRVALFLALMGHEAEAAPMASAAARLDQLNPFVHDNNAYVLYILRRYRESIDAAAQAIAASTGLSYSYWYVGASKLALGDAEGALAAVAHMGADNENRQVIETVALHQLGRASQSEAVFARLRERWGDSGDYQYAEVYAQLGRSEQAFSALQSALGTRDPGLSSLRSDRLLDPIRSDPRFQRLLTELAFA